MTTTYLFPLSVNGSGLEMGIGCNGGLVILPLAVEIAHSGQVFVNLTVSLNILSTI